MKKQYNVAVVGATGLVGKTMLKVLHERNFPVRDVVLFALNETVTDTPFGKKNVYAAHIQKRFVNRNLLYVGRKI